MSHPTWQGDERRADNLNERVAVLEAKLSSVEESNAAILAQLQKISTELTRYKGFIGGVVFVVSGVITLLGFLWNGWGGR